MKVCIHCFNDHELRQFIVTNSTEKGKCDYCADSFETELLDIGELLDFFAEFIAIFKIDSQGIALSKLIQNDWNLFPDDWKCNIILSDILISLNSSIIDPSICVSYIDEIIECASYWESLKSEIKWNIRFLTNIDKLDDLHWPILLKDTVLLSRSDQLFRARLHYSGDQKEFDTINMGCPDKSVVSAGRANPQGIPFLYLSKNIETTLYEIRATFLDDVSIGTFKIKGDCDVVLVDFTEIASAFLNVDKIVDYAKSMLLKRDISTDLSKPIRRYDSELEYIPTQFICEYIRYNNKEAAGIMFDSSLHIGGKNIVLFDQNKVECISVEKHRVTNVVIEAKSININE